MEGDVGRERIAVGHGARLAHEVVARGETDDGAVVAGIGGHNVAIGGGIGHRGAARPDTRGRGLAVNAVGPHRIGGRTVRGHDGQFNVAQGRGVALVVAHLVEREARGDVGDGGSGLVAGVGVRRRGARGRAAARIRGIEARHGAGGLGHAVGVGLAVAVVLGQVGRRIGAIIGPLPAVLAPRPRGLAGDRGHVLPRRVLRRGVLSRGSLEGEGRSLVRGAVIVGVSRDEAGYPEGVPRLLAAQGDGLELVGEGLVGLAGGVAEGAVATHRGVAPVEIIRAYGVEKSVPARDDLDGAVAVRRAALVIGR